MGRECSACHIAWLSDAYYPSANLGKDLPRISAHEEGKSIGRFLGARLSDHGRNAATSAATGEGLHQTDSHETGIFAAP